MQNIWLLEKTSKLNSLIQTQVHAKNELLYMYSMFKLSIQNNTFTTEYNIRISFIHVSLQPVEIMTRWIIEGLTRSWSRLHNEDQNAWRYNMRTTNIVIHKKEQKSGKISKTKIKEVRLVYSSQEKTLTPSKKKTKRYIPDTIDYGSTFFWLKRCKGSKRTGRRDDLWLEIHLWKHQTLTCRWMYIYSLFLLCYF